MLISYYISEVIFYKTTDKSDLTFTSRWLIDAIFLIFPRKQDLKHSMQIVYYEMSNAVSWEKVRKKLSSAECFTQSAKDKHRHPRLYKMHSSNINMDMHILVKQEWWQPKPRNSGKQCRSWSLWTISSGSTLLAKISVLVWRAEWVNPSLAEPGYVLPLQTV